jgi:hypothetical protein
MAETVVGNGVRGLNGNGRDIALAFPLDGTAPDMAARLALASCLQRYYTAYLGDPSTFARIPRLNTDPRFVDIEDSWLRWEDAQADPARLPASADTFVDWFLEVRNRHVQPAFCRYLAEDATIAEIALFFLAEELVDSRFDDLVALAQVGSAGTAKLTMAENYWDEMGEGHLDRMHTRLFEHSARYMRHRIAEWDIDVSELHCTEVYENANIVLMYGIHRHLTPRALGAMGLMEYSAPVRFQAMVDGCTRLGVPADVVHYQRIHVHVDADHGAEWLENVLLPMAAESPAALQEIGMGVLTRERIANAYYEQVWQLMKALR